MKRAFVLLLIFCGAFFGSLISEGGITMINLLATFMVYSGAVTIMVLANE